MNPRPQSQGERVLQYALLAFLVLLYGVYYPWFMYHNVPSVEGMFHLNSQSPGEAWDTAVNGWKTANARFGEFCTYFLYGAPLHVVLSIIHPQFMLLLAVGIQRTATGKWPGLGTPSLLLLCYISLFMATASPITDWWPDNFNWVYPCGVAMLFFALSEPLFRQEPISTGRFITLLLLAPIVGMGNEILVLTALPLFSAPAGWLLLRQRKLFTDARYWVIALVLLANFALFFSSPCWGARMAACGFSAGPLDRLAPLADPIRYAMLASPAYGCIAALTLACYLFFRKKKSAAPPKRLQLLLLIGLGYLLLTMVIPGYYPHREYRCLQFYGICIFAAMYTAILLRPQRSKIAALLLLPIAGTCFFYMRGQVRDAFIRCNLWDNLAAAAREKAPQNGILFLSEAEWNALVEAAHTYNGKCLESELEIDRLVLKTDHHPSPATLHSHKAAVTVYSVYTPEEQTLILLSSSIPANLLHKCSPDILLNRAVAHKVGLNGLVVVKTPFSPPLYAGPRF